MAVDISKELVFLRQVPQIGNYLGDALQRLLSGVNNLGNHVAVDPAGTMPPPPPIQQLTVKSSGTGLVHAVISDNNKLSKNLHYFVEYDTNPGFPQPQVAHIGATRQMAPINLPAKDDDGNPQKFYFRAYSQYQGGHPGPAVHFGGTTPEPVDPGGTHQMTLIPSTGSGTAQNTGQEGASGFGKILIRPATAKKRTI